MEINYLDKHNILSHPVTAWAQVLIWLVYLCKKNCIFKSISFLKLSMRLVALICSSYLMFFSLGAKKNAYSGTEVASLPPNSTSKISSESLCFQE